MKKMQIVKGDEVIAEQESHDITEGGFADIAHKNVPCLIRYIEDDEVIYTHRYDGKTLSVDK